MGRRLNYAAKKDARIKPRKEECAPNTEERVYVATLDVQVKPRMEECAFNMGQRLNDADTKDV